MGQDSETKLTACQYCFSDNDVDKCSDFVCSWCKKENACLDKLGFNCPRCFILLGCSSNMSKVQCPGCHKIIELFDHLNEIQSKNVDYIRNKQKEIKLVKRKSKDYSKRINPYLLFCNEMKSRNKETVEKIGVPEYAKQLGKVWKENKDIRDFFSKKAEELRKRQ